MRPSWVPAAAAGVLDGPDLRREPAINPWFLRRGLHDGRVSTGGANMCPAPSGTTRSGEPRPS